MIGTETNLISSAISNVSTSMLNIERWPLASLIKSNILDNSSVINRRHVIDDDIDYILKELSRKISNEKYKSLEVTLIIDLYNLHLRNVFIYKLMEMIYFPRFYDGPPTERNAKRKRIIIANPDRDTLLGMSQCLELSRAHCMVLPDLSREPWTLLYVGHIDSRLKATLGEVLIAKEEGVTSRKLLDNALLQRTIKQIDMVNELNKYSYQLRELFDFGLVNRVQKKPIKQGRLYYEYVFFHPYQLIKEGFYPRKLQYFRMPRPIRKDSSNVTNDNAEEYEHIF